MMAPLLKHNSELLFNTRQERRLLSTESNDLRRDTRDLVATQDEVTELDWARLGPCQRSQSPEAFWEPQQFKLTVTVLGAYDHETINPHPSLSLMRNNEE